MAVRYPVNPQTYQALAAAGSAASANQPEVVPYVFYDSQDFASNWTSVAFFASTSSDATISNIEQPNTISAEQFFNIWAITLDWLIAATAVTAAGAASIVDDLAQIQAGARAIFNMQISQKKYLQVPIHALHSSGGINATIVGSTTANSMTNYAQNWYPDGGYNIGGALLLPPKQTFQVTVTGVAATLVATRKGRISMHGPLFRRVV